MFYFFSVGLIVTCFLKIQSIFTSPDAWWTHYVFFGSLLIVNFCYKISKEYHLSAGLMSAWVLISGLYTSGWVGNMYFHFPSNVGGAIRENAAYATLIASLLLIGYHSIHKKAYRLEPIWGFLCLANSIYVIAQFLNGNEFLFRGGMFINGSINGVFIAMTYPFLVFQSYGIFKKERAIQLILAPIPIVAIILSKTSVPVGCIALSILVFGVAKGLGSKKTVIISIVSFFLIFLFASLYDENLFYDSYRFRYWKHSYDYFMTRPLNHFIGFGTGTFKVFGIIIQDTYKYFGWDGNAKMIFMHNDWLQILLEQGYIGVVLTIYLCVAILFRQLKNRRFILLSATAAFCGGMTFDYPFHYPIHAFFGVWLIGQTFEKKGEIQ